MDVSSGIRWDSLKIVMAIKTADAECRGNLAQGSAHMRFRSGAFDGLYDYRSRMAEDKGTNPEELLGAALAGRFPTALALHLTNPGVTVNSIHTRAKFHFEERDGGWSIHRIDLDTEASIPIWRRRPSRSMRRTSRRTAQSREPCPESIFIFWPSFCGVRRLNILCAYIFMWRASPG